MFNKRGQGLPMNTIIIAIIVIVVLIAIIVFFLGGFRNVADSISGIWGTSVVGDNKDLAIQKCTDWCESAKKMDDPSKSSYKTQTFDIDSDGDGEISNDEKNQNCETLGVKCDLK